MQQYLLTVLIFLPFAGALAIAAHGLFAPYANEKHYRWIALGFSLVTFAASLLLLTQPVGLGAGGAYHFVQDVPWVESIGAHYHVGVDGISLWLVILTTLLLPISILSSWTSVEKRPLAFFTFMLLLESAMIGVFVSLDLLLFYLFFEASLVPMFFLIGAWGGERRLYAAVKFFIYTAVGSLLMLAGIIWVWYLYANGAGGGVGTFDYALLLDALQQGKMSLTASGIATREQAVLFGLFALAFCIKIPLFPFHTWLPDAHTEAPTAGSVILAGVLLKMGTYGLMRFNFALFPEATRSSRRSSSCSPSSAS